MCLQINLSETGTSQLSINTYYGLLKLLSTCASSSPAVAQQLLEKGTPGIIKSLLANSALLPSSTSASASSMLRSADQLFLVLSLTCELLPPVPEAPTLVLQGQPALPPPEASGSSGSSSAPGEAATDERAAYLKADSGTLNLFCQDLLPLLLQLYSATVMPQVGFGWGAWGAWDVIIRCLEGL